MIKYAKINSMELNNTDKLFKMATAFYQTDQQRMHNHQ